MQPPAPPRRPALRPGVHVLRRSADEVQVGLDPRRALVLPAAEPYRSTLEALAHPGPADPSAYDAETLALLTAADLLVDHDIVLPLVPSGPAATATAAGDAAALASTAGDRVAETLARRAGRTIAVHAAGGTQAAGVATLVTRLLTDVGVRALQVQTGEGRSPDVDTTGPAPHVAALVVVGEPARELVDGWMREGTPHVLLRLTEGRVLLGPFVVPGSTACLRCVDAHHTDVDPAWPLLVAQYAAATRRGRADALPEPVDPLLATLAAAWVARDLLSHLEGRNPSTASTTLCLDAHLTSLEAQTWARHAGCGCTWGEKVRGSWTGS